MYVKYFGMSMLALALSFAGAAAWAQIVKVTPLGTHPGELCDRDRARYPRRFVESCAYRSYRRPEDRRAALR